MAVSLRSRPPPWRNAYAQGRSDFCHIFVQELCSGWHVARAAVRRRTPMRRAAVGCLGGVLLLWVGAADADSQHLNQLLHGDYAVVGEGTCLVALPPGFNPDLMP